MTLASSTTARRVKHTIQLRHLVTRKPITSFSARLTEVVPGWSLSRATGGILVVSALERLVTKVPASVTVSLDDPVTTSLLDLSLLAAPMVWANKHEVEIPLDQAHRVVDLPPAPQSIRVTVSDDTGNAVMGADVIIRSSSGGMSETALEIGNGDYQTSLRTFTNAFATFQVLIGNTEARTAGLDSLHQTTHVHVTDPN